MAYTPYQPYDWETGEVITEGKLDHIEEGLVAASEQIAENESDVAELNEQMPTKATIDQSYSDLGSGYTTTLKPTKYNKDEQPYLFRKALGARLTSEKIVGGTVAWNQLVGANDLTVTVPSGHKYFARIDGTASIGESDGTAMSVTGGVDMVTDLTLALGTTIANYIYALEQATAGAGVAFLRNNGFMLKDYYAYNAGELMSVLTSAHVTTGKNLCINTGYVQGVLGWKDSADTVLSNVKYITSPYIHVPSNTAITVTAIKGNIVRLYLIDSSHNILHFHGNNPTTGNSYTIPANADAMYIRFSIGTDDSAYTPSDYGVSLLAQIELGSTATTYEPYEEHLYPLSPVSLRGIMTLENGKLKNDGDEYYPDGTVTRRYGLVDLGTLNWSYDSTHTMFITSIDGMSISPTKKGISDKYLVIDDWIGSERWINGNMLITLGGNDAFVRAKNTAYTDAAIFKTAMSGVYLVYELATPTTETTDPYQSEQTCSEYGTEQFIDERDVPIPVGHVTKYWPDLVAKIEALPDVTAIAPTENGSTASQAYSVGQYFFRNGEFCKAKTNIASGATFTLNTNYETTTIAAELYAALNS